MDAGPPDAGPPDSGPPLPTLGYGFATPHAIQWTWDPNALALGATGYALFVGVDPAEVAAHIGQTRRWDSNDDPSLASRTTPHLTGGLIDRTIVTDLTPSTTYWAELEIVTTGGEVPAAWGSAATIAVPPRSLVIFDETMVGSWWQCFETTVTGHPHSGSWALWFNSSGGWCNADLHEVMVSTASLSDPLTDATYLEFFLDVGPNPDSYPPVGYMEVQFETGSAGTWTNFASPRNFLVLPGNPGWNRIQVPLRVFSLGGSPLTAAGLQGYVRTFRIGATFPAGRTIYVDDVTIRY